MAGIGDLDALFEGVDGLKEDLKEYGMIAAAAVGANIAFNYATNFVLSKWAAPDWAKKYGIPAAAVVAGLVGGKYVGKHNRKAGMGVSIGLVAGGLSMLVKQFAPQLPLNGLGAAEDQMLLGLGAQPDMFQRYLEAAPSSVEEVSGFGAPVTVEDQMGAPVTVEDSNGVDGFDGAATFA